MITKEEIKKEVDKLPDNLLDEVYKLLRSLSAEQSLVPKQWTERNFKGKFDQLDIRSSAYE
ncbi:MAG: hypothetical protein ACK5RG_06515 [Cyclobacteriaceae bacterium]|jgi:hypothetical protein|nr:hypothetical protein [Flammeovirgaceae bacterium]